MTSNNCGIGSNMKTKRGMQSDRNNIITPLYPPKVKPGRLNKMTKIVSGSTTALLPPPGKSRKLHNCLPPATPRSGIANPNLKRKSISMVELTSSSKIWTQRKLTSKEEGDNTKINHVIITVDRKCTVSFINTREEYELARKACKMFLLNAWRRSRDQVKILRINKQKVEKEVENLNIQVVVLQSLLESEKLRVAVAMSDSAHLKGRLEAELKNTEQLKKEIESLRVAILNSEKVQKHMDSKIKQLKSKLISEQDKCKNYQEVIATEQKQVALSRQREIEYVQKIHKTEATLTEKIDKIEAIRHSVNELMEEIAKTRSENAQLQGEREIKENEINEHIAKIKEYKINITHIQKKCKAQQDTIKQLNKDYEFAKEHIKDQSETIERLNVVVSEFEKERKEVDKNLFSIRNKVMFQVIRIATSLLFPEPPHYRV